MKVSIEENRKTKELAIKSIDDYTEKLLTSDEKEQAKVGKLGAWLIKFINYLTFEKEFNPKALKRYKRGEIVKVHLGYNVGSEEGGLHYCLVLDKYNAQMSPVLTVIPLTSVKPDKDLNNLHPMEVFLGNELYTNLNTKNNTIKKKVEEEIESLEGILADIKEKNEDSGQHEIAKNLKERVKTLRKQVLLTKKIDSEIQKMKKGSIALVNQIRVISKIRIMDPKKNSDVLSGVKISDEKLDAIDRVVMESFTNYSQRKD